MEEIQRLPKVEMADTLECSGNSRSLLKDKASGNPWTIGGVGNAIWGGIWLKDMLDSAGLRDGAKHVSFEGFFMDKVYRIFQKGEDSKSGQVVKDIQVKSIIVEPEKDQILPAGIVPVRGAAYAGEAGIEKVEVSVDLGKTWHPAELIGPEQPYAWRHWEYLWEVKAGGDYTIMARATDTSGQEQPETAHWNALGYGNNGVREHAVTVCINE